MVPGDEKDDRFQAQKKKNTVASLKTVQKKMCLEGSNLQDVQNEIELTILHSSGHACSMLPPPPKKEQNKTNLQSAFVLILLEQSKKTTSE